MRNFIIVKILQYIGRKTDGYKTIGAGIGSILFGIIGIIGVMYPDHKLVELSFEESVFAILGGLGLLGFGSKVEKVKNVLKENGNGDDRPKS